jgi:hypothetical protein
VATEKSKSDQSQPAGAPPKARKAAKGGVSKKAAMIAFLGIGVVFAVIFVGPFMRQKAPPKAGEVQGQADPKTTPNKKARGGADAAFVPDIPDVLGQGTKHDDVPTPLAGAGGANGVASVSAGDEGQDLRARLADKHTGGLAVVQPSAESTPPDADAAAAAMAVFTQKAPQVTHSAASAVGPSLPPPPLPTGGEANQDAADAAASLRARIADKNAGGLVQRETQPGCDAGYQMSHETGACERSNLTPPPVPLSGGNDLPPPSGGRAAQVQVHHTPTAEEKFAEEVALAREAAFLKAITSQIQVQAGAGGSVAATPMDAKLQKLEQQRKEMEAERIKAEARVRAAEQQVQSAGVGPIAYVYPRSSAGKVGPGETAMDDLVYHETGVEAQART